jgi:hypothetical protein
MDQVWRVAAHEALEEGVLELGGDSAAANDHALDADQLVDVWRATGRQE